MLGIFGAPLAFVIKCVKHHAEFKMLFLRSFLVLMASGLFLFAPLAHAQAAQNAERNPICRIEVQVDDTLRFTPSSIEVPSQCNGFEVLLRHTGRLPKAAAPRNWVLTASGDADAVAREAELAGAANSWIKPDDKRVLAASSVIGRGETVRIMIDADLLRPGETYTYLSTIPGFSPVLRGTLTAAP